jgi:hypothetical protein
METEQMQPCSWVTEREPGAGPREEVAVEMDSACEPQVIHRELFC